MSIEEYQDEDSQLLSSPTQAVSGLDDPNPYCLTDRPAVLIAGIPNTLKSLCSKVPCVKVALMLFAGALILIFAVLGTTFTVLGKVPRTLASTELTGTVETQGDTLVVTDCGTDSAHYQKMVVDSLQYAAPTSQSLAGTYVTLSRMSKSDLTIQQDNYNGTYYSGTSRNQKLAQLDDIAFLGEGSHINITITITGGSEGLMTLSIFQTYADYIKFGDGAVNGSNLKFPINATVNASTFIPYTAPKDGLYFYGVFTQNIQSFIYNYMVHRATYEKPNSFSCTLTSESNPCHLNISGSGDDCLIAYTEPGEDISDPFYTMDTVKSGEHTKAFSWGRPAGIAAFVLLALALVVSAVSGATYLWRKRKRIQESRH